MILESEYIIKLEGITKVYGTGMAATYALRGIDLNILQGDFVAIMGPSGSGKSTAMNMIGCLDVPTEGKYFFKDIDVGRLNRNQRALLRRHYLGFVFQGYNLLGRTTAVENVALPLVYRGVPSAKRHTLAMEALDKVGLQDVSHHTPAELSGGQLQRVAIARAIVTEPLVLLADEPTGNLDTLKSKEIMKLLQSFNRELGITVIMVTHEKEMAAFANRTVYFRDGSIESDHPNSEDT